MCHACCLEMRIKPSRNLLLGLCSVLALVFLYYWSWRIILQNWSNKSCLFNNNEGQDFGAQCVKSNTAVYDEQGFRRNLNVRLPLELEYKYGNLSKGACKPGFAAAKMAAIRSDRFTEHAPMFLDPKYKQFSKISDFPPPFGVKNQAKYIDILLSASKHFGLGKELDGMKCKKCIIIGNGGILAKKSLGQKIDQFDVVVRLNEAPLKGFEKDVGSKTTIRITYPEGAFKETKHYDNQSLFVLSAFKGEDLKWMNNMISYPKLRIEGFWKSVPTRVPRKPRDIRILHPYFIQEASFKLIGLPQHNGQMGRGNIPTLGAVAITMALHNCDEVAVAGFGYNLSTPNAPLHYYEDTRMSAIRQSWTHDIPKETKYLEKLVKAGVIEDLTNGICGSGC